jgi:hypothetical protein
MDRENMFLSRLKDQGMKWSIQATDFRVKLDILSYRFELSADTLFAKNGYGNSP